MEYASINFTKIVYVSKTSKDITKQRSVLLMNRDAKASNKILANGFQKHGDMHIIKIYHEMGIIQRMLVNIQRTQKQNKILKILQSSQVDAEK